MFWVQIGVIVLVLGVLLWRAFTKERREYAAFRAAQTTAERQRFYLRWLIEGALLLGGFAALTLLVGRDWIVPALDDVRARPPLAALSGGMGISIMIGASIGILAALVLPLLSRKPPPVTVGDIEALVPRNRAELWYGAGLSVSAGVTEELLFRLGLPALLFAVTGNGPLAFAVPLLAFGLLHVYQGWAGVLGVTVLGLLFTAAYAASGSILLAIALHTVVNLRALVATPMLVHRVHRVHRIDRGEPPQG